MSSACEPFRNLVAEALPQPGELDRLSAHEHARACPACGALLRRERALDRLLASVPEATTPADLGQRVLAGLAAARGQAAADGPTDGPTDGELDELLEHLPAPTVPAGLPGRVLSGLAGERAPALRPQPSRRWPLMALAASLLALLAAWVWLRGRSPDSASEALFDDLAELELDEELLLYAAERWDLLHDDDLDVWLASLDPEDTLLMEFADGEDWAEPAGRKR